tara:strand:- start:4556 stop:6397 length:1842 start_codon:yes stop_codon:yes gene_type:complete
MCGIIGVLGIECDEIILNGLRQLQNRGYDSAGMSTILSSKFIVSKYASTDQTLALDKLSCQKHKHINSINGMGHTRWATHGPKTDINSHPHLSMSGIISVIHNGIIENYIDLKQMLEDNGYKFISQTDTEVISNLIEYYYNIDKSMVNAIKQSIEIMEGTWGLVIQNIQYPKYIWCTRHGSPILVSDNDAFALIASEQSGFCNLTNNYFVLQNYDICSIFLKNSKINIHTNECYIKKEIRIDEVQSLTPDPFDHWMIKEIYEQPDSCLRAIRGRLQEISVRLGGINSFRGNLKDISNIILLGCGTSYHAGMIGMHYFKELCNFNTVQVIDGAEFTLYDIPRIGKTACILLSQSGETKDLHRCIQIGKENNLFLIGVVNVVDSLIARECHCGCYLNSGREISVASTKSFTSQVILLSMIAIWFSQINEINETIRMQYINDLRNLHKNINEVIKKNDEFIQKKVLPMFENKQSCFLLGKEKGESIAREGALKIKEVSYIHAEGYSTSSLKHGPFALLDPGFPVIIIAMDNKYYSKVCNAYEEIKSRHAFILFITNDQNTVIKDDENTIVMTIPINNTFNELLSIYPIQLISYYLSVNKGFNPDLPRNLAKVVSVE